MISSDNPIYSNQSTDMLETISNNSIINNNDNHDNTNADKDALHLLIHKPKPPPRRSSSIIKVHLQEADRTIVPALEIFSDHTIDDEDATLSVAYDKSRSRGIFGKRMNFDQSFQANEYTTEPDHLSKAQQPHMKQQHTIEELNKAAAEATAISVVELTRNAFSNLQLQQQQQQQLTSKLEDSKPQRQSLLSLQLSSVLDCAEEFSPSTPARSMSPSVATTLLSPSNRLLSRRKSKTFQTIESLSTPRGVSVVIDSEDVIASSSSGTAGSLNLIDEEEIANTIAYLTASLKKSSAVQQHMMMRATVQSPSSQSLPTTPTVASSNSILGGGTSGNRERLALRNLSHDRRRISILYTNGGAENNSLTTALSSNDENKDGTLPAVAPVDPFFLVEPSAAGTYKPVITRYGKARFSMKASMPEEAMDGGVSLEIPTESLALINSTSDGGPAAGSKTMTEDAMEQLRTLHMSPDHQGEFTRKSNHIVDGYCYFPLELTHRDYLFRVFDLVGNGIRSVVVSNIKSRSSTIISTPTTAMGNNSSLHTQTIGSGGRGSPSIVGIGSSGRGSPSIVGIGSGGRGTPPIPPPPPPPPPISSNVTPSKEVLYISSGVASTIKKQSPMMNIMSSVSRAGSIFESPSPPLRQSLSVNNTRHKSILGNSISMSKNNSPLDVMNQNNSSANYPIAVPSDDNVVPELYDCIHLLEMILSDKSTNNPNPFPENIKNLARTLLNIYEQELQQTSLNASGYLGDFSSLFNCAKLLISTIYDTSYTNNSTAGSDQVSVVLIELNELQTQMNEHRKYKEERMQKMDMSWEDSMVVSAERLSLKPFGSRSGSRSGSTSTENSAVNSIGSLRNSVRKSYQDQTKGKKNSSISFESMLPTPSTISDMNLLYEKIVRRSKGVKANLLFGLIPRNVAVIELMLCVTGIRDLLVQYKEYHKRQGHRAETIFLRTFIDALEQQLTVDLSSIGAFKISAARDQSTTNDLSVLPTIAYENNNSTNITNTFNETTSFEIGSGFVNNLSSPTTTAHGNSSSTLRRKSLDATTIGSDNNNVNDHMAFMLNQIFVDLDDLSVKLALEQEQQEQEQLQLQAQKIASRNNSLNQNTNRGNSIHPLSLKQTNGSIYTINNNDNNNQDRVKSNFEETKEAIHAKRRSWSSMTAGNDLGGTLAESQLISKIDMRASVRNGKYLLQRMNELIAHCDKITLDLQECCSFILKMRAYIIQTDIENETESSDLMESQQQEETIREIIKELQDLKSQMSHRLAPLHLTHHEELNGMLSSVDFQNELASKLLSEPLVTGTGMRREHVSSSIASLLIRSKSVALVHSVFANWPNLIVEYRSNLVHSNSGIIYSSEERHANENIRDSSFMTQTTTGSRTREHGISDGQHSSTVNSIMKTSTSKIFAKDVDVLSILNFDDIKSLRQIGFTLLQLRDSKCYDLKGLLAAGFPLSEVKLLKECSSEGMHLLHTLITSKDLRLAGYSIKQCLSVGFDVSSLRAGGFSDYDLVKSNLFTIKELKQIGCDIQRISLLALFQATDGKHWRNKTNWGSPTLPLSKWFGITVDGSGNVIKIDLRSNCLKGQLPAALSLLTSLKELDLYNNLLFGNIPEEYVSLVNLQDLWLACTDLKIDRPRLQVLLPKCKLRL